MIFDGKKYREETQEEIKQREDMQAQYEAQELHRQYGLLESLEIILKGSINKVEIADSDSLRMKAYYPTFEEVIDKTLLKGFKFTYKNDLWKVRQEHKVQAIYPPSMDTASLYERIDEVHLGNKYDPIPYVPPMTLERSKCYSQNNSVYECIEDTIVVMTHDLKDLPRYVKQVSF